MFARVFVFLWMLLCSAVTSALSPPALTVEYAAERKIETDSGDMRGKVNAAPGMERNETQVADMSTVMILRMDKKTGWMLMPTQKMYQELDLKQAGKQAGAVTPEQTELELVGAETISGQQANKYKFVMKDKSAGGFLWYTASGIPVKMDVLSKDGGKRTRMTVTLENIQIGTQDRSLFEVPAGFTKLPSGGLFGAMAGGMGGGAATNASTQGSGSQSGPRRGGFLGGGLLGGLKDAVTRPIKNEATAVASEAAAAEHAPAAAVEQAVTDEVKEAGARATVRGAVKSVGGLFRKN